MSWFDKINSTALKNWFINTTRSSVIKQGKKLDPFVSSMRKLHLAQGRMNSIAGGVALPGDSSQIKSDLASMGLFDNGAGDLTVLGQQVLTDWNSFNIPPDDEAYEVHRCYLLIKKAIELKVPAYVDFLEFWLEIRKNFSFAFLQNAPEVLYFFSYFNKEDNGYNPYNAIIGLKMNDADFTATINWNAIDAFYNDSSLKAAVAKYQSTIGGYASRQGRTNFCTALEMFAYPNEKSDIIDSLPSNIDKTKLREIVSTPYFNELVAANKIFFGAPGTGKSHKINQYVTEANSVRITFHPDTDYSTFVGTYKPTESTSGSGKITYDFTPQQFITAYTKAWLTTKPTYLIIEEINRGNCAQIFGDIFQLLERDMNGYSLYPIDVDTDIKNYLKKFFEAERSAGGSKAINAQRYFDYFSNNFGKISLPNNLLIHATMNTSDQSLFPVDSAFKRRWDWEYVPISFDDLDAATYKIQIGVNNYSWSQFITEINNRIEIISENEDKKLGPYFIKSQNAIIPSASFKAKVLFYIWSDVLKDEVRGNDNYFFKSLDITGGNPIPQPFTFNDLFNGDDVATLQGFMKFLNISPI